MVDPWENPVTPTQMEESRAALMGVFDDSHTTQVAVESVKPILQSSREIKDPKHVSVVGMPQLQEEPSQMVDALPRRLEIACSVKNDIRAMALEPHFSTGEFADHHPDEYRNFSFTLMQFSVFLCMDLRQLERLYEDSLGSFWFDQLRHIEALFGTFLQNSPHEKLKKPFFKSDSRKACHPKAADDRSVRRSATEREIAKIRDGERCFLTGTTQVDVCHIWPFATNNTRERAEDARLTLQRCMSIMSSEGSGFRRLFEKLCPLGEVGASDKAWNMLTMAPTQHRDWSDVRFGLRFVEDSIVDEVPDLTCDSSAGPMGSKKKAVDEAPDMPQSKAMKSSSGPTTRIRSKNPGAPESLGTQDNDEPQWSTYKVELYYMPESITKALKPLAAGPKDTPAAKKHLKLDTDEQVESVRAALSTGLNLNLVGTAGSTIRDASGRLIESGHVFSLRTATADVQNTVAMIRSQWLMVKMAAFSAAAEARDELNRKPPPTPHKQAWIELLGDPRENQTIRHRAPSVEASRQSGPQETKEEGD